MKTILLLATLDTKGEEAQYVKELIEKRGHAILILDMSGFGRAALKADITAEEVAKAAGGNIEEVRAFKSAGQATEVMTRGAEKVVRSLYNAGRFHGILSVGGGTGAAMASAVMRQLPIGLPKFMLVTQHVVQAGLKGYVGTNDIAVMPSVVDIAGLNRLTMRSLNNATNAIIGMVEPTETEVSEKPLVFMTMLGITTTCGLMIKELLVKKGFEVMIFHAVGLGGMTLESLIETYPVSGVIELSLNEIGNELFGGLASAGPNRLEAAGRLGIPQIITPGNVDTITFFSPETVPDRYKARNLHHHNPQATGLRTNAEELKIVGETIAKKLNQAKGPVKVLIPTRGFSSLDIEGGVFYDPVADMAFINSLKSSLDKRIPVEEIDANINDERFAKIAADRFLDIIGFSHNT